jgi:FkbM family methyltransferase
MKFQYKGRDFHITGALEKDHLYKVICNTGTFYEIALLKYIAYFMKHSKRENSIAIDVGANIGNHSIFFQSFLTEYVIAVEPNPKVLTALKRNLAANIEKYTIYENGLGESLGRGSVILPDHSTNNVGMAKLNLGSGDISVTTLDSMMEDWYAQYNVKGRTILIKIDVEGMELSVLKGAKKTIETYRPHLFIEATTDSEFSDIENYLERFGYQPICHYGITPVYHFCYVPTQYALHKAQWSHMRFTIQKRIRQRLQKWGVS